MKLNGRAGALAVVIKSEVARNIGRVYRLISLLPEYEHGITRVSLGNGTTGATIRRVWEIDGEFIWNIKKSGINIEQASLTFVEDECIRLLDPGETEEESVTAMEKLHKTDVPEHV